ncbi:MAG: hypothetical protein HY040_24230 [Planctomycetes bacterium]|nr:hypothetical protein [Planctomycetota bacterium]
MATFVATTASNCPRLKNPEAAGKVLERYFWDGDLTVTCAKDEQTGHSHLNVYGYEWPGGWRIPDGVDPEEFELDYDVDSSDGFEDFLKEIAPFLAEPLTVQSVGSEKCRFPISACEWHVRPGTAKVEVNGFSYSCPEAETYSETPSTTDGKPFLLVPCSIDWSLLAGQKRWLLGHATKSEEAAGLVNLLDAIQDAAVDRAAIPEAVVFPQEEQIKPSQV